MSRLMVWRRRRFNPLPSQKQGETAGPRMYQECYWLVSIRSPHKSKGRLVRAYRPPPTPEFQSAPLTKARGDIIHRLEAVHTLTVSIRSPHKSKGRHNVIKHSRIQGVVSIRSPHKSKGRLEMGNGPRGRATFQSAPLTKARGDQKESTSMQHHRSFNPLPSQKQGETRTNQRTSTHCRVSIRSPHKSKGRRESLIHKSSILLFQSAPLTKARGDV